MACADIDKAMAAGWACGRLLWANPVGIYRDDVFERVLVERLGPVRAPVSRSGRMLHVISTPYASGGHTRLLEKLVAANSAMSDVLVTRPYERSANTLRLAEDTKVFCDPAGFDVPDVAALLCGYREVVLYIHPDDIHAALAVGLARRQQADLRVIFVNHADHAFSFGFFSSDMVAEVSTFGFQLSQKKRQLPSGFLGIPVQLGGEYAACVARPGALHVISAGSALKFKPSNGASFPALAMNILRHIPDSRVTVIGPRLSANPWWLLPKLCFPFRLRLSPVVPYPEYLQLVREASVYVDSIPMGGGTALPEVRSLGSPVTGVETGATGYTPFDETKYADATALVNALKAYAASGSGEILERNNNPELLRAAGENHDIEAVSLRLRAMLERAHVFAPIADIGVADTGFYEKQWQERGVVNIDRDVVAFVLGMPRGEQWPVIRAMLLAMGWGPRVRFFFRYIRVALSCGVR